MSLEDQLRSIILERYKSVHAFADVVKIPNSTIDSVLKRGIYNSGVGTVIKIFNGLNLDLESVSEGQIRAKVNSDISIFKPPVKKITELFAQLNSEGQERVIDYADDLVSSGKYKKDNTFRLGEKEA